MRRWGSCVTWRAGLLGAGGLQRGGWGVGAGGLEYHAWMKRNFQWDQLSVFHNSCPVICEITWSCVKGGMEGWVARGGGF